MLTADKADKVSSACQYYVFSVFTSRADVNLLHVE